MSKRTKELLNANNELEKQLNDQEQRILTDISAYIRHAGTSPYYQESVRQDIITMVLDGSKRGLSVAEIIGEDYQSFCDSVLKELPKLSGREKAFSLLRDVLPSVMVLLGIWFVFSLLDAFLVVNTLPFIPITAGDLLGFLLIIPAAFYIFNFISKTAFSESKSLDKKLFAMIFAVIFLAMIFSIFLKYTLFQVHALIVLAVFALLFCFYLLLDKNVD